MTTPDEFQLEVTQYAAEALAQKVCEQAETVTELQELLSETKTILYEYVKAMASFPCQDKGAVTPCEVCWPCTARLGLTPVTLH